MKTQNSLILIMSCLMLSLLSGCSSNNVESMKYYSLNLPVDDSRMMRSEGKVRVVIDDIELPQFLKQDNLVIQLDDQEIYTASYNRWAEPLEVAISKLLVTQLNSEDEKFRYERSAGEWNRGAAVHPRIEFSEFHHKKTGDAVIAGRLWVYDNDKSPIIDRSFHFQEPLAEDGYAQVVVALRNGLSKVSSEIVRLMRNNLDSNIEID
ncbi:MAG: putative lipoprotein YmbA [Flavobacterium sp.]|jgi:uncharacterized lipoprotein YmbA